MKNVLKYLGIGLLAVVVVVAIVAIVMMQKGAGKLGQQYTVAGEPVQVVSDSASLAYGRYIAESHGCMHCHGSNLAGSVMADVPPFRAVATNLTGGSGGIGSSYTDADWERAIRHGVRPDSTGLFIMPASQYYYLSDSETSDLIAYLKSLEPVDTDHPKTEFKPLGKFIAGVSPDFQLEPDMMLGAPRMEMPELGPTEEWGAYRASTLCTMCHGPDLQGAQPPDPNSPFAPDLRPAQGWTLDQFKETLKTGVTPDGRELNEEFMPIMATKNLSDTELEALYAYIKQL